MAAKAQRYKVDLVGDALPGLETLPMCIFGYTYGGGSELRVQPTIYCGKTEGQVPKWLKEEATTSAWMATEALRAIPVNDRAIARNTPSFPEEVMWDEPVFTVIQADGDYMSFGNHGWLFREDIVHDRERLGVSRAPLVGIWRDVGLGEEQREYGYTCASKNSVSFQDQHIHVVEEVLDLGEGVPFVLREWLMGSDSSRVFLKGDCCMWVVVMDAQDEGSGRRWRAQAALVVVVRERIEFEKERVVDAMDVVCGVVDEDVVKMLKEENGSIE